MTEIAVKRVDDFLKVKGIKDGMLTAVASTPALDRDGERMLPTSFVESLAAYRANPVILGNHDHGYSGPRPTIIGSASRIEVVDGVLEFDMTFASTIAGQEWRTLFEERHARAFSVGFIPKEGSVIDDVYTHTKVDLLEISAVAVPSNREALRRGMSEAAVETVVRRAVERAEAKRAEQILKDFNRRLKG